MTFQMTRVAALIALTFSMISPNNANYLEEYPVKMLSVEALAVRIPAADSKYRVSITNGFDEDSGRTEGEVLNSFPPERTILNPGGCASYSLPFRVDQTSVMVHPARKMGSVYQDYCNKGKVEAEVSINGKADKVRFDCFTDPTSCSSKACLGQVGPVLADLDQEDLEAVHTCRLSLCVPANETRTASLWEINISSSNDSNRIVGTFGQEAQLRLRGLQDVPEYDTYVTMVSIVGGRGVGKSTVASLLSGNASMFVVGSASTGTTTTGADMSGVIPSAEYAKVIGSKVTGGGQVFQPPKNTPFFIIDSEGMGVRGDAFDFITTSPPAVVASLIIWIGSGSLQVVDILESVNNYLKGLDNIVLDEDEVLDGEDQGGQGGGCPDPKYGHFVIVINKMMGDASDQQLTTELLTIEPDQIPGYEERNEIRVKLMTCFEDITVIGLPILVIESGDAVDYDILPKRFMEGLTKMANKVVDATLRPRTVTVGSISMELNATTAEVIIGTVIEEANKGKLDLTGFGPFWTYVKQDVKVQLEKASEDLLVTAPRCRLAGTAGMECPPCVCSYRTKVVEATAAKVREMVRSSSAQAGVVFQVDASPHADELLAAQLDPWVQANSCQGVHAGNGKFEANATTVIDIGEIQGSPPPAELAVKALFACGTTKFAHDPSVAAISISADSVFIDDGTTLDLGPPPKPARGPTGVGPGAHGSPGAAGVKGTDLTISGRALLRLSSKALTVFARGGDGADGGDGVAGTPGAPGLDGKDGARGVDGAGGGPGTDATGVPTEMDPTTATAVVDFGEQIDYSEECDRHCACNIKRCEFRTTFQIVRNTESVGGVGGQGSSGTDGDPGADGADGGKGGNGGNGGAGGNGAHGGSVSVVVGDAGVVANVQKIGGKGGKPGAGALGGPGGAGGKAGQGGVGGAAGPGGPGGMGLKQTRRFTARHVKKEKYDCGDWFGGCDDGEEEWDDSFNAEVGPLEPCCQGMTGNTGNEGKTGPNGANGKSGENGQDGVNGAPGKDAGNS